MESPFLLWLCPAKLHLTSEKELKCYHLQEALPATSQPSPAPANIQTDTQIHTVEMSILYFRRPLFILQGTMVLLLFG